MTVLFSDIRGFTTLSEAGQPEAIIDQLNEYFSHMVELLFQHKGTLDKFVGDMIMALFNAPLDDPDHADHAVQMGLAMLRELQELNRKWESEGRPHFDIGIGINTGAMIGGFVGSEKTLSYTVMAAECESGVAAGVFEQRIPLSYHHQRSDLPAIEGELQHHVSRFG